MHDIPLNRATFRYFLTIFRYVISDIENIFSDFLPLYFHAHAIWLWREEIGVLEYI